MGSEPTAMSDRIVTVPNALSVVRVVGVPVFLWLLLGPHADWWAFWLLVLSGITDWADGKLARLLDQSSRLGSMLDPVADRLYMVATPVAFAIRGILPWWVVGVLVGREILLACALPVYRRRGFGPPEVTYLGKAATFTLMIALPLVLAGHGGSTVAHVIHPAALALLWWGVGLYIWTGLLYLGQAGRTVRAVPAPRGPRAAATSGDGGQ